MDIRVLLKAACLTALIALSAACHKSPYLSLKSPDSIQSPSAGGPLAISFSTNCPWTAESSADWCKPSVTSGAAAEGISLKVDCDENTDHNPRSCRVTVRTESGSFSVKVNQSEALMVILSQEPVTLGWKDCVFSLNIQFNTPYTVTIQGGDWLTCASTRSLSGAQEAFAAESNTSLSERSAVIVIEGEGIDTIRIPVLQEGYSHPVLNESEPGFYGFGEALGYTPGRDQIGIVRRESTADFRLLSPSTGTVGEVTGIPAALESDVLFDGSITIVRNSALRHSEDCTIKVLKVSGNMAWLTLDDEKGIIIRL